MRSDPSLTVVIPAHDAASTITAQLDALAAGLVAAPDTQIVVVDNRSTDATAAVVAQWARASGVAVEVIAANERTGEPYARNVGLSAARSAAIAYCDADDEVGPRWIGAMCEALADAHYATGPIDMTRLNEAWLAGVRGTSVTDGRSLLYNEIPYAHGCNMGFRTATLRALGGFDETYMAGCDLDIAIRLWESGHTLVFREDATVAYRLRPSLRATFDQGVFYGRYRVRIRKQLAGRVDIGDHRVKMLRRRLWLLRHLPECAWSRPTRARWAWVAGQLLGERRGEREGP